MPTISQLVRHGRKRKIAKVKAPAMRKNWNSLKQRPESKFRARPQKRGVCIQVRTMTPEEAELGPAQDRPRSPDQRDGGHGLHPGQGHNLQEHSVVLVRGGRVKDLPAVSTTSSGARWTPRVSRPQAGPQQVRRQGDAGCGGQEEMPRRARSPEDQVPDAPANRTTSRFTAKLMTRRQAHRRSASSTMRWPGPRRRPAGRGSRCSRRRCATRPRSSRSSRAASVAPPTRSRWRSGATAALARRALARPGRAERAARAWREARRRIRRRQWPGRSGQAPRRHPQDGRGQPSIRPLQVVDEASSLRGCE